MTSQNLVHLKPDGPVLVGRRWIAAPRGAALLSSRQPYQLRITIHQLPAMNHTATRASRWAQNRDGEFWRALIVALVPSFLRPAEPLRNARATFTRHSARQPDQAQLGVSFKRIEDALCRSAWNRSAKRPRWIARADVLYDDAPKYLKSEYTWAKGPRKGGFVTVEIEEVLP